MSNDAFFFTLDVALVVFSNSLLIWKVADLGPVQTGTQSFQFVPYRFENWNAEGLRSDGNSSNRTGPFQKMNLLNK